MRLTRIISLIGGIIVVAGLLMVGWFGYEAFETGFSARPEPSALEVTAARFVRRLAIPRRYRDMANPIAPGTAVLAESRAHFADHCATCHANNGSGDTTIGRNLYPKAPDLRNRTIQQMSDGELAFIIHHGIRFTGMPAWGEGKLEDDLDTWKLVHFIRHLPRLTDEELEEMKSLNPKTRHQLEDEALFEHFLQGGEVPDPAREHRH